MNRCFRPLLVISAMILLAMPFGAPKAMARSVVDSRGVAVALPETVRSVATISDGLVEEVMIALGVQAQMVAIGSTCLVRDFTYDFVSNSGERFSYLGGMNPANYLKPSLRELPFFVKPGTEMNFETLASVKPDVLVIHAGTCTINWKAGEDQKMGVTLAKLQALGIPTVVLYGPNFSGDPSVTSLSDNIRILGHVFAETEKANKLAGYLEAQVQVIADRTVDVKPEQMPRVLLFGLNPTVRKSGGAGTASGLKDIQSWMLEHIVRAKNAFQDDSHGKDLNAEQVLALKPEVFILPTANGYHPPRELYDTPDFKHLQLLPAIQQRRVASLPWSPCNCDQRLEYPLVVMTMAKAVHPDRFRDVSLHAWMISFFREVYSVDAARAEGIIDSLWMDWARDR